MADEDNIIQPVVGGEEPEEEEPQEEPGEEETGEGEEQAGREDSGSSRQKKRRPQRRVQPKLTPTKKPKEADKDSGAKAKKPTFMEKAAKVAPGVVQAAKNIKDLPKTAKQFGKDIVGLPEAALGELKSVPGGLGRAGKKWARRLKDPKRTAQAAGRLGMRGLRELGPLVSPKLTKNLALRGLKSAGKGALGQLTEGAKSAPNVMLSALGAQDSEARKPAQAVEQVKRLADKAAAAPREAYEKAKELYETPRKIRTAIRTARRAIQLAQKAAQYIAKVAPKMAQAAVKAAQAAAKAAQAIIKLIAAIAAYWWPILLVMVILIAIYVGLYYLFGGGVAYINSLAGGSVFIPADPNNLAHVQIIDNLYSKMQGCDPKLVIYDKGKGDLGWQTDDEGNKYHLLDIRLLKTLDYLTDKHDRIMIGLLRSGGPKVMRGAVLTGVAQSQAAEKAWQEQLNMSEQERAFLDINLYGTDEDGVYEVWHRAETLSAYGTGQAMAILEIDRSQIPGLTRVDNGCGTLVAPPVEVAWQDNLKDKVADSSDLGRYDEVRTAWEELGVLAGFIDRNLGVYQNLSVAEQWQIDRIITTLHLNFDMYDPEIEFDLYTETFLKINRIPDILKNKVLTRKNNLNQSSADRFQQAFDNFDAIGQTLNLGPKILDWTGISDEEWTTKIRYLGEEETIIKFKDSIRYLYDALHVANIEGWLDRGRSESYKKAYEARQKIRQVILELKRMPNEAYLEPPDPNQITPGQDLIHFDPNLVVKQIITWSPEDDLDNGEEYIDIFPRGYLSVDIDGMAFDEALRDGKVDYADAHFSHSPIDNGVFSMPNAQFVFLNPRPTILNWISNPFLKNILMPGMGVVVGGQSIDDYIRQEVISSVWRIKDDSLSGLGAFWVCSEEDRKLLSILDPTQLIQDAMITTVPVSFRKFLHVAF